MLVNSSGMPPFTRRALACLAALSLTVTLAPRAGAAAPVEGVPRFDHVVVLVEENEAAATTFAPGSPATYLKGLRSKGAFLPNYYGTGHASLDNYITMVSGQRPQPLTMADCLAVSLWTCVQPQGQIAGGRNLADQLEEKGLSWKSYQDGTPTPCFHANYAAGDPQPDPYQGASATGAKNYADRHNPFLYFPNVIGNQKRCDAHQRPFTELAKDLKTNTLPAFSFITPDTCNDGHDNPCAGLKVGGLVTADAFLKKNVPALAAYLAAHNGLLIVNFDEGGTPTGPQDAVANSAEYSCPTCAGLGLGGRTGAILVSPRLKQGLVANTGYDHYSLLRTLEDAFGITEYLGGAAQAAPFTEAFAGSR